MNRLISQKFRFYSFICISLLMFVHGYNMQQTYLTPFTIVNEPLTFTGFFEYFFANGFLRFRIPMLFMISGYIFAYQDYKPYGERIKKRFVSLIIPFFIWSAVGLLITWLWQQNAVTAQAVALAKVDQFGDQRPYEEIGWGGILIRWIFLPPSYQLWFIRNLFVYNLLYPFFKWVIKKYPVPWFLIAFFLMFTIFQFFLLDGQGLFFFTLGIWINKSNFSLEKPPSWFNGYLFWLIFIGFVVIKTFMAFEFESEQTSRIPSLVMNTLHFFAVMAGVLAVWFTCDGIVKFFMSKRKFVMITSFSFIIFGLHVPLLNYIMQLAYMFGHNIPYYRLLFYIFIPVLVWVFCIAFGAVLRRILPSVYSVITGGRGI